MGDDNYSDRQYIRHSDLDEMHNLACAWARRPGLGAFGAKLGIKILCKVAMKSQFGVYGRHSNLNHRKPRTCIPFANWEAKWNLTLLIKFGRLPFPQLLGIAEAPS